MLWRHTLAVFLLVQSGCFNHEGAPVCTRPCQEFCLLRTAIRYTCDGVSGNYSVWLSNELPVLTPVNGHSSVESVQQVHQVLWDPGGHVQVGDKILVMIGTPEAYWLGSHLVLTYDRGNGLSSHGAFSKNGDSGQWQRDNLPMPDYTPEEIAQAVTMTDRDACRKYLEPLHPTSCK